MEVLQPRQLLSATGLSIDSWDAPHVAFVEDGGFQAAASDTSGVRDPNAVLTPANLPLQPVGVPFVDPVFGTVLRRVSDTSGQGGFETQIYNQLQPFSADNQYLLLVGSDGYLVRRVDDLGRVEGLDTSTWNAPRWHPTVPHTIVHYDSNADTTVRVQYTNVDTLVTTTAYTFPAQYEYVRVNQSFDELSHDGRWMAGMLTRNDSESVLFSLDLQSGSLGVEISIGEIYAGPADPDPQWGEVEPDWVGVSPLGNYMVVQWVRDGDDRASGLEAWDIQTGQHLGHITDHHHHGDLGVDSDGVTEVFMTTAMSSPMDPNIPATAVHRLPGTDPVSTPVYLQPLDWTDEDHISMQGPNGVGLVSWGTYDGVIDEPFEDELFLQNTDGSVQRLVHHRSSKCGYWVQPRASMSRDGRYVVFASDWGQPGCGGDGLGQGDPYIIDLMAGADTPGLYDPATAGFYLKHSNSQGGGADVAFAYGPSGNLGWIPLVGDFNGNGADTVGLYDPATAAFHLKNSNVSGGGADVVFSFGPSGDRGWTPLVGDFDGDGTDTVGLYDPASGAFHLKNSNSSGGGADLAFTFGPGGNAGWQPLIGDFNGDGRDTVGLYDPAAAGFHLKNTNSQGGGPDLAFAYGPGGNRGWTPLVGDWNADATDSIGLYDSATGAFHLKNTNLSGGGADLVFSYGPSGSAWIPLRGDFNGLVPPPAASADTAGSEAASPAEADAGAILTEAFARWDAGRIEPGPQRSAVDSGAVDRVDLLMLATDAVGR